MIFTLILSKSLDSVPEPQATGTHQLNTSATFYFHVAKSDRNDFLFKVNSVRTRTVSARANQNRRYNRRRRADRTPVSDAESSVLNTKHAFPQAHSHLASKDSFSIFVPNASFALFQ